MSRSSEEVLLSVPHVRHKKTDGTLYLMGERLGWMVQSKKQNAFSVVLKYADVKSQKISPEGKPKIQLQLALHDGSSTTFHFAQPEGQARQVRERDSVKEMLQQLLPKFKKKVNKELEERHRMLKDNPGLLQLYKDLVITQIMKPEEFWEQHAPVNGLRAAGSGVPNLQVQSQSQGSSQGRQDVGVSGSFLSDIKPQADGANGIKYNLTVDVINSIFKTYPAVKKKHFENVPSKMSEQDFWNRFFQSHYFHRDRIHGQGVKDIFTECAKDDDRAIRAQLTSGVSDRFANIAAFSDSTIDECYGTGEETSTGAKYGKSGSGAAVGAASAANIVHQNIIKRFNQHSIMVMKATDKTQEQPQQQNPVSGQPSQQSANNDEGAGSNSKRLREMVEFEDLDAPPAKKQASLKLAKVERYLNGPTPASGATSEQYMHVSEVGKSRTDLRKFLSGWERGNSLSSLSASNAVSALVELSPGGTLMKTSRGDALVTQCPDSVRVELRQLYGSLSEVLRHFWACFPPTTPDLAVKADKSLETLKGFHELKLKPFENQLARNYSGSGMNSPLTSHLNQMLDAAYRKHETWKQKKVKR